jgi:hypothetical protein
VQANAANSNLTQQVLRLEGFANSSFTAQAQRQPSPPQLDWFEQVLE